VTLLAEYDGGVDPTDPWDKYSMFSRLDEMGVIKLYLDNDGT